MVASHVLCAIVTVRQIDTAADRRERERERERDTHTPLNRFIEGSVLWFLLSLLLWLRLRLLCCPRFLGKLFVRVQATASFNHARCHEHETAFSYCSTLLWEERGGGNE